MNDLPLPQAKPASRITCCVHQRLAARAAEVLDGFGLPDVLVQSARCVRQQALPRPWPLPGVATSLNDSPTDIFRITCQREAAVSIMNALIDAVELSASGRGSIYAQNIDDYASSLPDLPALESEESPAKAKIGLLTDFSLITAILSGTGNENSFARQALELRAGAPVISLGIGTGIRDRLGLLRITIPPEKEIVHLVVPAHDADGILRLLVETAHMDRPGGGFLYRTPVCFGRIDPMMRIGQQQHAASIEQIIAAVDDLKAGTAWRQRFRGADRQMTRNANGGIRLQYHYREITFICAEGCADLLVKSAMQAGAGAATVSGVRRLRSETRTATDGAREIGTLIVPTRDVDGIVKELLSAHAQTPEIDLRLQLLETQAVFSHQR